MSSPQPPGRRRRPPPPAKPEALSPTTIHDIGDDLILRIFLHLPSLPSLVRAAFTCRAFLAAVRSSPAFRRRFRELHAPPLLGLFLMPSATDVRSYTRLRRRSDPDFTAAVRASDFLLTGFPNEMKATLQWCVADCRGGYILFFDGCFTARMMAAYNPLTRAIYVFPAPVDEIAGGRDYRHFSYLGHHMLACDESPGSFRVLSIFRRGSRQLRAAIFSSGTRQWQILPWTEYVPAQRQRPRYEQLCTGALVKGSLYLSHLKQDYSLVLNTATLQFSWMDLPDQLKGKEHIYRIGESKDGNLCIVSAIELTLLTWLRRADAEGVEKWVLDNVIQLEAEVLKAMDVGVLEVWGILDGIVHLLTRTTGGISCWFLSFCLETRKLEKIVEKTFHNNFVCPYVMAWPNSFVGNDMGV